MKLSEIHIRDPFVLVHEGRYYMYGTFGPDCWNHNRSHFDVYVSDDLENWSQPHCCFEAPQGYWGEYNFWAPEVHVRNGKFYLCASFKSDCHCRGTAILCADSPMGPFVPHSDGAVTPADWECLDGTLYTDQKGRTHMIFCHEWVQVGDGEMCVIPLTDDLKRADGEAVCLFKASQADWVKPLRRKGRENYVTDGPFMWRTESGELLCLWASFSQGGYTEGIAVSSNGEIDGEFRQAEPLFRENGGHGMVFRALDGHLYLTMHTPNENPDERPIFKKIKETQNSLTIDE